MCDTYEWSEKQMIFNFSSAKMKIKPLKIVLI